MTTPFLDDRFLILGPLGRGGMATVFRAFDRVTQRIVAIKVQTEVQQAGPSHPLSEEFDLWTRLVHPNIVRVLELGVVRSGPLLRGSPYLVLQHVRGRPADRALLPGRVGFRALEGFAVQALRALRQVHAASLVHRDVKPSNLLTETSGGRIKKVMLTDFGLASLSGRSEEPGRISGSLPFVSPEMLLGLPLDGRSDLYGLGVVLFLLATGSLPMGDGGVLEVLRWHLTDEPADPSSIRPELSPRLTDLIRRMTARDPRRRPADAARALNCLGIRGDKKISAPFPAKNRGDRANLRLALDATRLGCRRRYDLPPEGPLRRDLLREAWVWSQIRGIGFHRIRAGSVAGERSLSELVMRLLLDRGGRAVRLAKRFHLRRWLPLGILAGAPVADPIGPAVSNRARRVRTREAGAAIVGFVMACARERPLVITVEPFVRPDPLVSAVLDGLRREVEATGLPHTGRGGILLLESRPAFAPLPRAAESGLPVRAVAQAQCQDAL
jgi:hypothetical protein